MKYQFNSLLFITVLAFVGATQPFPNEANIAAGMNNPIEPELASVGWEGRGHGHHHHHKKGSSKEREFEAERSKKRLRELDEHERTRKRTWERESGTDITKSRDIHSRAADIEKRRREGRTRTRF